MSVRPDGSVEINGCLLPAALVPYWQRAIECARAGDMGSAVDDLKAILDAQPGFVPAIVQAAYFMLSMDRYRDARDSALTAAAVTAPRADLTLELIRLLRRFEEHEAVSALVERTRWIDVGNPELLIAAAAELGPIGLYEQADRLLRLAEKFAPRHPRLAVLRGTIHMMSGDTATARRSLRSALQGTDLPHVLWMLTMQPDGSETTEQVEAIEAALRRVASGTEDEAYLWFGLHNLHHAAGHYEEAWSALERGMHVKRCLVRYSSDEQRALFDRLRRFELPAGSTAGQKDAGSWPRPVFIVGMHRSGTSILERVLSKHSDVVDGGESYVFTAAMRYATDHYSSGPIDMVMVDRASHADLTCAGDRFRRYARWKAQVKRCFTEKLPSNFLHLGFILSAMPDAVVLNMRRDPIDTCFSNLRTFFGQAAPYSYDQKELADYFLGYQALMRHWHERFPGRIMDVDYTAFVAEPNVQAQAVMEFCGLPYEADALQVDAPGGFTATASIGSVRKGILKDRGGVWKNYLPHLQPLLDGLSRE